MLYRWNMDMRSIMGVLVCLFFGQCALLPGSRATEFGLLPNDTQGQTGFSEPDLSYCQMILEAPVPPTADQVPWFCICSACSGNRGQKGDRGDRGLSGVPGSPGPRGLSGLPGRPGFTGRPGIKGEKGDAGDKGDLGYPGVSGPKGGRGFKGEKGELGLEGPTGEQGPKGDDGQCPETCEPIPGQAGEPGLPGPAGARGLPGLNGDLGPKGMKGDPGVVGERGLPGVPGGKGDQGPQGLCNCKDGAQGAQGQTGEKGEKGNLGPTGEQGTTGATGPKGDQGDMGMTGIPGPCSPTVQSTFSAALLTSLPQPSRPVPFKRVIYNLNQNYNPDNGVYTAPVNGTYVFSYHLQVSNRALKVGLFHNFEAMVRTTTPTAEMNTASQQVVLSLSQGDWVWVQVKDVNTNGMYAGSEASSTFSGFLLYPDRCDDMFGRDIIGGTLNTEKNPPENDEAYSWGISETLPTSPTP
ncbi:complement C1q and tumor necrosis factor-related protein 9-like [Sinocyclocheilus grahami]|uniref:complement C1q and tumor necrosis factor-related protein 9-like n=1 Tax=Sinocyclocheilus grahami TaxID=75366 RepID=UPI0007ACA7C2|nr:PREDICTED: complement C1q and tumor necrosis factor-related protein 9-like [Sinocyclocheilus grahami]